ncbi:MAG: pitrilysin family protein [Elainellaceae cyanobacterium]
MFHPLRQASGHRLSRIDLTSRWRSLRRLAAGALVALLVFTAGTPLAHAQAATAQAATAQAATEAVGDRIQSYIDRTLERITEFTLDNGIKFIVLERHNAPVVSFMTYVNVGAAEESDGLTGAAHYLEHLAFKGTSLIGTTDYSAEKEQLAELDQLFEEIKVAEAANDVEQVEQLAEAFELLQAEASGYVRQNELPRIVEQAGGVGLNATTSADATRYFYSLPSNKLELWMSLESERFLDPVFREFYEEKDVILEERRLRVDNSPIGKMIEQFLATAFQTHPYRRPSIGYEDDLRGMEREDVQAFFERYYTPDRMTLAVVGDVDPDDVERLAKAYFGRYPARPPAPEIVIEEPQQQEPQSFTLRLPSQPWYLEGYHRPGLDDPDHTVYQLISAVLSNGRTSRLYENLVEGQQIALTAQSLNGFPGDRFDNMIVFYALTAPGYTVEDLAAAIDVELNRLKTEPVSQQELDRVRAQARAGLLRTLASNSGMASLLPEYEAKTGSWRNLFEELSQIEAVTADDIQRVAQQTFRPENRTVGKLLPIEDS